MTFMEVIEHLRDGKAYKFTHENLSGFFYKAPFPEDEKQTQIDGACSAITFWNEGQLASPTLMLYDFDDDCEWTCEPAFRHPANEVND